MMYSRPLSSSRCLLTCAAATLLLVCVGTAAAQQTPADTSDPRAQLPLHSVAGVELPPTEPAPIDDERIERVLADAQTMFADEEYAEAITTLEPLLEEPAGRCVPVYRLLAQARAALGFDELALETAQQALKLGDATADLHYLLGGLHRARGELDRARAHFRTAALAQANEPASTKATLAWYRLGEILQKQGFLHAAAEAYQKFDQTLWVDHPEQRQTPQIAAVLALRQFGMVPERFDLFSRVGDHEQVMQTAEFARQQWPDQPATARWYALALIANDRSADAFTFCQQQLSDSATAIDTLTPVAIQAAAAAGQLDAWLAELSMAVASGEGITLAETAVDALLAQNHAPAAVALATQLAQAAPADEAALWRQLTALHAAGDLPAALKHLTIFVGEHPDAVKLPPHRLADLTDWVKDSDLDVDQLDLAAPAGEPDFAAQFVRGVCALAKGQDDLATSLLEACHAARPEFLPAQIVRVQWLLTRQQWQIAREVAEQILERQPDSAAAHFALAEALAGLDANDEAEEHYKRAVELNPTASDYKIKLALHYRRLGNLLGAQRYFQSVLTHDPHHGEALEGLIDCYVRSGKVEIARAQMERINRSRVAPDTLRRLDTMMRHLADPFSEAHLADLAEQFRQHPRDLPTARLLAGGLYLRGRFDQALEVIHQARSAYPLNYELALLEASVDTQAGRFSKSAAVLAELAERFPRRVVVIERLALSYLNDFQIEAGRETLRRLIEIDPDNLEDYRGQLISTYMELGECEPGLELLEQWLAEQPDNQGYLAGKLTLLTDCGREEEAFAFVEQRLEQSPDDATLQGQLIWCGEQAGLFEKTIEYVAKWAEEDPENARLSETLVELLLAGNYPDRAIEVADKIEESYYQSLQRRVWLGRAHALKKEYDFALAEFEALLQERSPDDAMRQALRSLIIETLIEAKHYDDAIERCEQWLEEAKSLDPQEQMRLRIEALSFKNRVFQFAGRDAENIAVLEELLKIAPDNAGLLNDLGYTLVDNHQQVERGTEMIRRAVAQVPWNYAYLDSLGWAYYVTGDFGNARKYLDRAAQLRDGREPVILDHLGDALYRTGDEAAARLRWQQALDVSGDMAPEQAAFLPAGLIDQIRAKLAALDAGQKPAVAPVYKDTNRNEQD